MKIKIAGGKAWVIITSKQTAMDIYRDKLFDLYLVPSGMPIKREADLNTKKKIGIKVQWKNEPFQYKEALHLKGLGYNMELELSCRLVLSNK